MNSKNIYFLVTNDLTYDQRMHRICTSLAENGYQVTLVGRKLPGSLPLEKKKYRQVRLRCLNRKGKLFYAEFNLRLFFYLLGKKMDAICAVDLDTILPCLRISKIKNIPRVYDAHEFFTELREVMSRPFIFRTWLRIEKSTVPQFKFAYTVSESIATKFRERYGVHFETIRNLPVLTSSPFQVPRENFILYQGAVNEARGFESLVPAMKDVNARLVICGNGNFMEKLKELIRRNGMESRIELKGMVPPAELSKIAARARVGIALSEREGLNQYLALPNKFLDYIHAGLPQVTMNFPEYRKINDRYRVALLLDDTDPARVSEALNNLLHNDVLYDELRANCLRAREELNWQQEEKKLLELYHNIFIH